MSIRIQAPKKPPAVVIALDIDQCSLIGNDTDGLRTAIAASHIASDDVALALMARLVNPRMCEAVSQLKKQNYQNFVFYTGKALIARGLHGHAPPGMWLPTGDTIRFAAGPLTREYLCHQVPSPVVREDLLGLGLVTWAMSVLLGFPMSAGVYVADECKSTAMLAKDLGVDRVVLFDDQAHTYARELGCETPRDANMVAVKPYTYSCLTKPHAMELEAFLSAHCQVHAPNDAPDLLDPHTTAWRIAERATGEPVPPWNLEDLLIIIDAD